MIAVITDANSCNYEVIIATIDRDVIDGSVVVKI